MYGFPTAEAEQFDDSRRRRLSCVQSNGCVITEQAIILIAEFANERLIGVQMRLISQQQ